MLVDGLTVGKGEISPEEVDAVIKKRIERTLIRTVANYIHFFLFFAVRDVSFS